ncbi:hypothetical protein [Methylobacterium sp. ID0610]|uniref:hypothetical protein n=1 Tax=Methylobacterium carpenticola TaxID=3344827 RepID=UPI0036BDE45F
MAFPYGHFCPSRFLSTNQSRTIAGSGRRAKVTTICKELISRPNPPIAMVRGRSIRWPGPAAARKGPGPGPGSMRSIAAAHGTGAACRNGRRTASAGTGAAPNERRQEQGGDAMPEDLHTSRSLSIIRAACAALALSATVLADPSAAQGPSEAAGGSAASPKSGSLANQSPTPATIRIPNGERIVLPMNAASTRDRTFRSVYVVGLPPGSVVSDSTHDATVTSDTRTLDVTSWNLDGISLRLPADIGSRSPDPIITSIVAVLPRSESGGSIRTETLATAVIIPEIASPPDAVEGRPAARNEPPPAAVEPQRTVTRDAGAKDASAKDTGIKDTGIKDTAKTRDAGKDADKAATAPVDKTWLDPKAAAASRPAEPRPVSTEPPRPVAGGAAAPAVPARAVLPARAGPEAAPADPSRTAAPKTAAPKTAEPKTAAPTMTRGPDENGLAPLLVRRAEQALQLGNVSGARLLLQRAVALGHAEAGTLLARTYDAAFLQSLGARGLKADPERARADQGVQRQATSVR